MTPTRRAPGAPRQALALALALALDVALVLLPACGSGGPAPVADCVTDPECGVGAYCLQGTCRASAAPVADFTGPAAPSSARNLTFQASVTDTDPGDAVARHDWTVTLVDASCDAEPEPTSGGALTVVFWCAGTYDVTLVATDLHGIASAPVTKRVGVAQSQNLPTVTASSPSLGTMHRCSGQPIACSTLAPLDLRSTSTDPGGGALALEWRSRPLNPLVSGAVVTYSPSGRQANTSASIVTPGTAIAGDWIFEVRATNPAGFMARASVTLPVLNRPPAISAAPLALEHAYRNGAYEAAGVLAASATDPDGDPIELTAGYDEPAASGCLATFEAATSAFSLSCTRPSDLIGGITRALAVTAVDVNGEASQAAAPIEILNRPPTIRLASSPADTEIAVAHGNGPCLDGAGTCYRVDGGQPFAGEDPDGDPLPGAALTPLVDGAAIHSLGQAPSGPSATFTFSTPHAFPDEFRAAEGASPFTLRGVVVDPFGATASGDARVRIGNRPPTVAAPASFVAVEHRYDPVPGEYVATAELATFDDPDGDPLAATGDGPPGCTEFGAGLTPGTVAVTCRMTYRPGAGDLPPLAAFLGSRAVVARMGDAWSAATAPSSVSVLDRLPTLASTAGPVMARCACVCPSLRTVLAGRAAWPLAALLNDPTPGGTSYPSVCTDCTPAPLEMTVDPGAADPDGDPLQLVYRSTGFPAETRTAVPSQAPLLTPLAFPATWEVTATDGNGTAGPLATALVNVTEVTCP